MRHVKTLSDKPVYVPETHFEGDAEDDMWRLSKEIRQFYETQFGGKEMVSGSAALLRGIKESDLESVARAGSDNLDNPDEIIYVTQYSDYALNHARSALLVYDAKQMQELNGDTEAMNRDFNRWAFLTSSQQALMAIIDLRAAVKTLRREVREARKTSA